MPRVPKLSRHQSGHFFIHYNRKDHYLGKDRREAERQYIEHLAHWREVTEAKRRATPSPRTGDVSVDALVDQFCISKRIERGFGCETYYLKHLKRFRTFAGEFSASLIRPSDVMSFKHRLIAAGLAPKTINHDLTAIRVMFNWATALELVPMVNFKGVKNLPLGPTQPRFVPREELSRQLRQAPEPLRPWLVVNYLALLRPSEVIRVVHQEGEWIEEGVFVLDRGKTDERAKIKRHCCFSPVALAWLECAEPRWSRLDSYSAAARRAGFQPKVLQKSGARHLAEQGVHRDDIDALLNHAVSGIGLHYWHPVWQRLRTVASQLAV